MEKLLELSVIHRNIRNIRVAQTLQNIPVKERKRTFIVGNKIMDIELLENTIVSR